MRNIAGLNANRRRAIAAIAMLISLSGCGYPGFMLWRGFRPPEASTAFHATNTTACPTVNLQNLSADDAAAIRRAMTDVCRVIDSSEFRTAVLADNSWLASCENPGGRPDLMPGADVYRRYIDGDRNFSLIIRKPWNAVAITNTFTRRVAIRRQRLDAWNGQDRAARAELIGTIVHEMSHLVWNDARSGPVFKDRGHGDACVNLVSYGLGNLARKLWLQTPG